MGLNTKKWISKELKNIDFILVQSFAWIKYGDMHHLNFQQILFKEVLHCKNLSSSKFYFKKIETNKFI